MRRCAPTIDAAKESAVVPHLLESELVKYRDKRLDEDQKAREEGKRIQRPFSMSSVDCLMGILCNVAMRQQLAPVCVEKGVKPSPTRGLERQELPPPLKRHCRSMLSCPCMEDAGSPADSFDLLTEAAIETEKRKREKADRTAADI